MKNLFTYLLLTIAAFTFSFSAQAKKQLYKGYIITTENDTIEGQVQYVNPAFNELKVIFYKDGKKQKFSTKDLKEYGFMVERYNKETKSKYNEWMHYEKLNVEKSPIRHGAKNIFVQRQLQGAISLYNFYTLKSTHVNKRSYEHAYYVKENGKLTLVTRKNYRKVVRKLVSSNEDLYNNLGTSGYGYKYFASVVEKQNLFLGAPYHLKTKERLAQKETPVSEETVEESISGDE